ncbi:MAG: aspartate kinase [Bdellovibrionales bacterium]|nr:aspartate kinase [Bdellovibrionales bacterium]
MLIIQKYGGTSLATPEHIRSAAKRIAGVKRAGHQLVVVVSAMGKMTNNLIALAKSTVGFAPQREMDMLLTTGERVSMALLAMALHEEGIPAISFTGSQCGIVTDSVHTDAKILEVRPDRIRSELDKDKVVIVAGFQGVSRDKEVTTLGRGGSDTTAVALAAALGADQCEILTDVEGLYSADPNIVDNAQLLRTCTYEEALEFASLGAKMHPRSIDLAKRFNVNVRIAPSADPKARGTQLVASLEEEPGAMERTRIRGIGSKDGYTLYRTRMDLSTLSERLSGVHFPLRFFSFTDTEVRFLCEPEKTAQVESVVPFVERIGPVALVSAVGDGIHSCAWVLSEFLKAIADTGAPCHFVCLNTLSVVAAVPSAFRESVASALHAVLVERSESGGQKKRELPEKGALQIEGLPTAGSPPYYENLT